MTDESELLRRSVSARSDRAFAELVQRKAGLVYSAALRQAGGHTLLAQDGRQTVFIDLARKAGQLTGRAELTRWLYPGTRFAALNALREKPPPPPRTGGPHHATN